MHVACATAKPGASEEFELDESYYRELEMDDDDLDAQTTFHADDIGVSFVLCADIPCNGAGPHTSTMH